MDLMVKSRQIELKMDHSMAGVLEQDFTAVKEQVGDRKKLSTQSPFNLCINRLQA